jgi:hypothetical protein
MKTARRARIHPYLRPELRDQLAKYCAATRTTESAVVADALERHFDGTSDFALFLRRLDRLSRGVERLERDQEIQHQAFALFVRLWLAHTPRIPGDARGAAIASAEARYRKYLDRLAENLGGGKRFVDDLPQEKIADDDELAAISRHAAEETAAGAAAPPSRGPPTELSEVAQETNAKPLGARHDESL